MCIYMYYISTIYDVRENCQNKTIYHICSSTLPVSSQKVVATTKNVQAATTHDPGEVAINVKIITKIASHICNIYIYMDTYRVSPSNTGMNIG